MKILFTSTDKTMDSMIDPRFGRAAFLLLHDEETTTQTVYDNAEAVSSGHGAGPLTAQKAYELKADVIVTGNGPGDKAASTLKVAGITVYVGAANMNLNEALQALQLGKLEKIEL